MQLSRTNEPLEVVVADLSHASGIRFVPEAGVVPGGAPGEFAFGTTARCGRRWRRCRGATRIAFEVREDAIRLYLSPGPGNTARSDTIIGRISVPGRGWMGC